MRQLIYKLIALAPRAHDDLIIFTCIRTSHPIIPSQNVLEYYVVDKVPGGPNVKVFVGTAVMLGLCAVPVFSKNEKRGHDLFSQEKPEAVVASTEKLQRQHYKNRQDEAEEQKN